jgi:uncharacterized membrane protein YhaH (DUF805 family)
MGNLLFSPSGRIGPGEFIKGAIILIVLGTLLSVPSIMGMEAFETITFILSLVLIYPWVVIWIKRYHDAGKSGWMCLIPIVVYLVLFIIAFTILLWPMMEMAMSMAAEGASESEMEAALLESGVDEQALSLQFTLASIAISLVVTFLFNALIKQDPGPNQFGPVPGTTTADNFS